MRKVEKTGRISMIRNDAVSFSEIPDFLTPAATEDVRNFHRSIPGYAPSPLKELKNYAEKFGVKSVLVKDESQRFGLNAFKGLGGVYAVNRIVCEQLGIDSGESTLELLKSEKYQE